MKRIVFAAAIAFTVVFTAPRAAAQLNFIQEPNSQAVNVGGIASFIALAGGVAPLAYQWYYSPTGTNDWLSLPAATNSTLTFTNLQTTNAGYYCVTVTNASGSETSDTVQLAVASGFTVSVAGENGGPLPIEFTGDGRGDSPSLAWTNAPAGTEEFALLMSTVPAPGEIKWNWVLWGIPAKTNGLGTNGSAGLFGVPSDGGFNPATGYAWPASQGPGTKYYTFTVYALSAAPTLTNSPNQVTGAVLTNAIASLTLASAAMTLNYTRTSPVCAFAYAVGASNSVNFINQSGRSALAWSWDFGDGSDTSTNENPSHGYTNTGTYTVSLSVLGGYGTNAISQPVNVPGPPSITGQPGSLTNYVGGNIAFAVAADGTVPLSYQWYYSTNTLVGWGPIKNATAATLRLNDLQVTNAGYYLVIITNAYGSKISASVRLTVRQSPGIFSPPVGSTAMVGGTAAFSVIAGGVLPLSYQWYYSLTGSNGWHPILTATKSTVTLSNLQLTNSAYYCVIVTNAYGSQTSAFAQLTVTNGVAPNIIIQPVSCTAVVGGAGGFGVVATGTAPLSYQWYYSLTGGNGWHPILTATNSTLALANLQLTNTAYYCVIVNNAFGSLTSVTNAQLTVTLRVVLSAAQLNAGKGNFNFLLAGPAGGNCVLQVSTNLLNWDSVRTSTIPVGGTLNLTNAIGGYDRRFYRVKLQ